MTEKRGDIIEHGGAEKTSTADKPEWLKKRLEWFMDQRFGLILHWGPYSQWNSCESWPLVPADTWARPDTLKEWTDRGKDLERFSQDYRALNRTFNPTAFDPDAWADLAATAGARYVTFTTKHHDGFCMFDTSTTDYRITHPDCPFHTHPRANVTREIFEAFRKKGLGIGCYFSKSDWNSPFYWAPDFPVTDRNPNYDTQKFPDRWQSFVTFVHRQVEELMTGYGPIDILWLDGGQVRPPKQDIRMDRLAAMARRHQPSLIIADRMSRGEYEDILTPEQKIPAATLGVPWESCITLGQAWKYVEGDICKPARTVIHMLVDTVAKGGNLLLGVGPDARGVIPAEAAARLREIGQWLKTNGEAIYGTRPVPPYTAGDVRFTSRGDRTYAILLRKEGEPAPASVFVGGFRPRAGTGVEILGMPDTPAWQPESDGFRVTLPPAARFETSALTFRFQR